MGFTDAVKSFFNNYATFSGRSSRSEFWYVMLFSLLAGFATGIVDAIIGAPLTNGLFCLAILIPSLALTSRRLHDTDHSFWWLLIVLVPFIGAILLLVWYCTKGTNGPNRFGPDPLLAIAA